MHARASEGVIDYLDFFSWLASLQPQDRRIDMPDGLSIVVESIRREGSRFFLRLLAGNPAEAPLIFDSLTGKSTIGAVDTRRWIASATRVTVDADPGTRLIAIELRRNGISSTNLERVLSRIGATHLEGLKFDLNPVATPSFIEEIESLVRIREATLVITRPNFDWDDHYDHLHQLADDSGAANASASVTADRGGSLNRSRGIVQHIKRLSRHPIPDVKNASIRGFRQGESQETTVSLERNQVQTRATVDTRADVEEQDQQVWRASRTLIEENAGLAHEQEAL